MSDPGRQRDAETGRAGIEDGEFARGAFEATELDAELRAAWRQPELSRATIEADPWTAVYLPVPERADQWLLLKAHDAARQCEEMIERGPGSGPQLPQGNDDAEDNRQRAAARAAELSQRLEAALEGGRMPSPYRPDEQDRKVWAEPAFSRDTIAADPWTAVYLPIPDEAEPELLADARNWVSDLRQGAEIGGRSNSVYFGPVMENM
jgi:hypothetical protein